MKDKYKIHISDEYIEYFPYFQSKNALNFSVMFFLFLNVFYITIITILIIYNSLNENLISILLFYSASLIISIYLIYKTKDSNKISRTKIYIDFKNVVISNETGLNNIIVNWENVFLIEFCDNLRYPENFFVIHYKTRDGNQNKIKIHIRSLERNDIQKFFPININVIEKKVYL